MESVRNSGLFIPLTFEDEGLPYRNRKKYTLFINLCPYIIDYSLFILYNKQDKLSNRGGNHDPDSFEPARPHTCCAAAGRSRRR